MTARKLPAPAGSANPFGRSVRQNRDFENGGHGGPAANSAIGRSNWRNHSCISLSDQATMSSRSTFASGKLDLKLARQSLSMSTAANVAKPARFNPRSKPPQPLNRERQLSAPLRAVTLPPQVLWLLPPRPSLAGPHSRSASHAHGDFP